MGQSTHLMQVRVLVERHAVFKAKWNVITQFVSQGLKLWRPIDRCQIGLKPLQPFLVLTRQRSRSNWGQHGSSSRFFFKKMCFNPSTLANGKESGFDDEFTEFFDQKYAGSNEHNHHPIVLR